MTKRKYPKGITKRKEGWRISLGPQGTHGRKSFPPATPQADVEAEAERMRNRLRAGKQTHKTGGLAGDVAAYLRDHYSGRTPSAYEERERHLELWIAVLGADTAKDAVTRDDVARVLNRWRSDGLAADTCNKRRAALAAFYTTLNGKSGYNPVRDVPKFAAPDPLPRGVAYAQIEKALEQMPRCPTRARLAVIAYTGARHDQVMRLNPDVHWDTRHRLLTIPGTQKGRGTKTYTIPLSPAATDALHEMENTNAWGRFTWAPMARMWRAAWIAATTGERYRTVFDHPKQFAHLSAPVPYDLRHSFGTQIYRETGDLKAVKEMMGHSVIRMSERYTLAAVPERQRRAIAAAFKGRKSPIRVASQRNR